MRSDKLSGLLAKLACSRSNLVTAIITAKACGDDDWVRNNRDHLRILTARVDSLAKVLPTNIVEEARELTNAPI